MGLIDPQLATGWHIVPPGQSRAQTLSLILTNAVTHNERGELILIGGTCWYPDYERESCATTLFKRGHLVLKKGNWLDAS
jgi:hypothetical protein